MKNLVKFISLSMLLIITAFMFTACVPANVDSAIEKMEDSGYIVSEPLITPSEQKAGVIGKIKAQKLDERYTPKYTIIALYFENENKAKSFYENGGGWFDSILTETGYEGKWAYASNSKQAVKDFKK